MLPFYRFYPKSAHRRGARHRLMLLITLLLAIGSMLWATIPVSAQSPGAALDFDGVDDYVTLPATLNNGFSANRITVEGWFYPTAQPGANQYFTWIGEAYTSDANVKFAIYQFGANLICGFYQNGWSATNGVAVTLNQWQHVACSYDQQNIKLYVNGAVAATASATVALPTGDGDWYLGQRWDGGDYYKGRMDEVRIWNRALSASEIASRMNCEPGGNPSGLVARYGFNQGNDQGDNSGVTSLTDSSSNAINGTLSGFALSGSASNWVAPGSAASGVACAAAPEIDVQGNGASITSGDSTPNTTDNTHFDRQTTGSTVAHTFTIHNSGAAALTGVAVTLNGDSAFSLTSTPDSSVAAGAGSNFTIAFTPSALGVYSATVSIASNDSDENPFTFIVLGIRTGSNVAEGQPATQSSTYPDDCTGPASKAVDGNVSGHVSECSFSTTNNEPQDWWQVDLGAPYPIQVIDLFNRTDCCGDRLSNFDLLVSTDGSNWTSFYYPGAAPTITSFIINQVVRYVKVQLRGQNYLTLAEVQVWGPALPDIDVQGNGASIANGDNTPTTADHTSFGNQLPGGTTVRRFTIRNSGAAALALSGSPVVAINGDSAFTVSSQPATNSIAANSSVPFTITFAPTAVGVVTATVSIANDDNNENPYTFVVGGAGVTANAQLNGVDCLLIDAINAANSDAASGTCPAGNGADTITLLQDVTLDAIDNANDNFYGANGLPQINSAITVEGAGYTLSRAAGAPAFRFFHVTAGGVLTLNDLTLHNGDVTPRSRQGGALYNEYGGTATVNRSTFTTNKAGSGAAIYNNGDLTLNQSTISGNVSTGNSGGIDNWGRLTVNNSTISGNSAGFNGGAIYNGEMVTVTNSTISDNSATNSGGGIYNNHEETLTLVRSLISGNRASAGAELANAPANPFSDPGIVNADNANLFGESSQTNDQALFNFTPGATDLTATSDGTHPTALAAILDTTLADNGGPTWTHALVAGSPALDAAGDSGLATDQRGVARPQSSADDIGAFELEPAPEMNVQGNGVSIANGDTTPAAADQTALGKAVVGGALARTFTIQNAGLAALTLSGSPLVAISGNSAFTVSSQPSGNSVAASGSVPFTVTFAPTAAGVVTATITIANDDSNENPYTFVISGEGIIANVQFQGVACNLIDAINAANSNAASGTCPAGSGADTITLLQDVSLISVDNTNVVNGPTGLPTISSAITIEGGGHTISRAAGAPAFRLFYVMLGGNLTLTNLTLSNGDVSSGGLADSQRGGAIYIVGGTATVNQSTITANKASLGGGIASWGTVTVNNSTISGNSATSRGGGIFNNSRTTVINSTISGNSATNSGGGIENGFATPLTLVRSLISGNGAPAGAELYNSTGNPPFSGPGIVNANNANLFGESSKTNAQALFNVTPGATDLTATSDGTHPTALAAILDTTLADNGGPTWTHALVAGSPALDAAGDSGFDTDQRGIARPQGAADDIGAFELEVVATPEINVQGNGVSITNGDSTPDSADQTAFGNVMVGSSLQRTFTISNSGNADLTDVLVTVDGSACAAGVNACAIPAGDFTLVSAPDATIAAGSSSSFTIEFAPTAAGQVEAVVSIASNDSDENPYEFAINGNGVAPTTITIVLDTRPDLPTNLGFGGSLRGFILDDPATDDGDSYTNSRTFTVAPGTYTVWRNNPNTWYTTAIACTPEGNATIDLPNRRAAITVAAGDNVTCTFTVDRAVRIIARAFNDLVRRNTYLGKRNAGDPWLNDWTMTVFTAPTATVTSTVTQPTPVVNLYEAHFRYLRPGSYTVCATLPDNAWTPTTPAAVDGAYGKPCKSVTLQPGQWAALLFGAYQSTVAASEAFTPEDEPITDEDAIVDLPYDPAEDETATAEDGAPRLFLPLVVR